MYNVALVVLNMYSHNQETHYMFQLFCTEPIEKYAKQSSEVNPFTDVDKLME